MGNVSSEMKTLRKNKKETLEIKNTITEMKDAFDGHQQAGQAEE